MRDPDGKLVLPGQLHPIAEETGQIQALDHWVLAHAIELMQHHPELSPLRQPVGQCAAGSVAAARTSNGC
jgi:EAL domain-containing protein (putative c-di-GMP-specific phosphodiesterase class I)